MSGQCSAELRPSHETTALQYAELCQLWSQLEERLAQRETSLQQMLALSHAFEDQLRGTTAKLVEISSDVSALKSNTPIDTESIQVELQRILAIKEKLDGMTNGEMLQLTGTLEQLTALASGSEFTDQVCYLIHTAGTVLTALFRHRA